MNVETARLAALCAIIDQDLRAIDRWDREVASASPVLDSGHTGFRDLAPIAYALHNIYNALENTCEQISRTFENHVTDPAQWHKELLSKMFLEIPHVRPAVLPEGLRAHLSDLRGFRHVFRHGYEFELDGEKLGRLVRDWRAAKITLCEALAGFRDSLLAQVARES